MKVARNLMMIPALGMSLAVSNLNANGFTDCVDAAASTYVGCLSGASGYWEEVWCYLAYEVEVAQCVVDPC
jgi:hypothetical protein